MSKSRWARRPGLATFRSGVSPWNRICPRSPGFLVALRICAEAKITRIEGLMSVLVTGGAGYIGSHMVLGLLDRGEQVVVLDNLVTGVRGLVAEGAHFVEGDIRDARLVRDLIERHAIDAVIHFA